MHRSADEDTLEEKCSHGHAPQISLLCNQQSQYYITAHAVLFSLEGTGRRLLLNPIDGLTGVCVCVCVGL